MQTRLLKANVTTVTRTKYHKRRFYFCNTVKPVLSGSPVNYGQIQGADRFKAIYPILQTESAIYRWRA